MAVLGIDLGTTGCKSCVYSENGTLLGSAYKEYERAADQKTIDFSAVFEDVKYVIFNSARGVKEQIEGISISSFGEVFVPTDKNLNVLSEGVMYNDYSSEENKEIIAKSISEDELGEITGLKNSPVYSLTKAMSFAKSSLYNKDVKFLCGEDFVIAKLCGEFVTDYSIASRTMAFDIKKKEFSQKLCDIAGISKDNFAQPLPSGTIVGKILPSIAEELGINKNCYIITGAHDQICTAIGCGVSDGKAFANGMGTIDCIISVFDDNIDKKSLISDNYCIVPFLDKNLYASYSFCMTGGSLLKSYSDKFLDKEKDFCKMNGNNIYAYMNDQISSEINDIMLLPHFAGAATPYMDTSAKGMVYGLDLSCTKYDIYKAILEGIAMEMNLNLNTLYKSKVQKPQSIIVAGGGARSDKWLQMKADIYNLKIQRCKHNEVGTAGVAMLALNALNKRTLIDSLKDFCGVDKTFYPDKEMVEKYAKKYEKYQKMYNLTKELRI